VPSENEITLGPKRSDGWRKVSAEVSGKDVSHLYYGPAKVRVGRHAAVTMACIGGVGTDKQHRRKGLARRVFAQAVAAMQGDAYTVAGLFTSRRLVAHRLYRRFGFVDVSSGRVAYKVLDPAALARRGLSSLVQQSPELGRRRLTLRLCFERSRTVYLKIEGNDVSVLSRAPRRLDLSLTMSPTTFLGLSTSGIGLSQAVGAKLVQWSGDAGAFDTLAKAIAAFQRPVDEE